ncbi:MAG TPA: helix-turn-helix domain-containing protein [Rhodanobacteraceae bacterium]|nr:helix-turn-helix domain-containing protein [Rhodanobacteraceae bacterium]
MSVTREQAASRALAALGISDMEECTYRALLARHTATAAEIARELSLSQRMARTLLGNIEAKGLATRTPETPSVYIAAPPEFTIETLIKQRLAMLEHAREVIPDLKGLAEQASNVRGYDRILELITNRANLSLVFSQMYGSARSEIVVFQRAPILLPTTRETKPLPAGVRARTISDAECLQTPGVLEWIRNDMERGEEARTYPSLPFKMMIVDRSIGLLTLVTDPEAPTLLVHRSALLEALCLLFEFAWEKATPILAVHGKLETGSVDGRLAEAADTLIPMLAAGLNDKAIALELGISAATLNRRIGELMKAYGTRTRFQLGWRIALETARASGTERDHAKVRSLRSVA